MARPLMPIGWSVTCRACARQWQAYQMPERCECGADRGRLVMESVELPKPPQPAKR